MLTLKALRESTDDVVRKLAKKGYDAKEQIADILNLDDNRKKLQQEIDSIKEYKQRLISDVVTGQIKVC